ncbi:PSD1 and planctomycete cytochrome C domain-containing protein [Aeoliella sp.]|uniref:PSD1 and planctomycete cytochrome C domain-containing protein n=1 Tax=Aeoliella sp. TaxID=2795800 RepID=UPI003CCC3C03
MKFFRTIGHATLIAMCSMPWLAQSVLGKEIEFNRDIRPILSGACFHCHGADEAHREADLRLDDRSDAVKDLGGYSAIVPGDPDASELLLRIETDDEALQMPPADSGKTITPQQRALLRQWIAQGAEYQQHWAFVPPAEPAVPATEGDSPATPIDRFISAELAEHALTASPRADKRTLIRRVTLDLTGLPPTPDEVRQFLADDSPDAYERVVDRLLASTASAERLAQEWLDVARYADTNGFSIDDHRDMWAWRDWVIRAMADNMPYDRFITEQLAGDLLPNATESQRIATGFLRNNMNTHEGGTIAEEYQMIYTVDRVDTVATAFLGLTLRCSQCHDHKYDPISQRDFYQFYALFDRCSEPGKGAKNGNTRPIIEVDPPFIQAEQLEQQRRRREAALLHSHEHLPTGLQVENDQSEEQLLSQALAAGESDAKQRSLADALQTPPADRTPEQRQAVNKAVEAKCDAVSDYRRSIEMELKIVRKALERGKTSVMVMDNRAAKRVTHIRIRGQYDQLGEAVEPSVLEFLLPAESDERADRRTLAEWLTSPEHPLTARVAVNRYWQMLFGVGLVETAEDFGMQGAYPSHPELLDWLARDFTSHGWDLRRLLKQLVMSDTYCQSSRVDSELLATDPKNRLLARSSRRRLPAESIRDNALAISGLLDRLAGGPSVYPPQPDGLWKEVSHYGHPTVFTAQAFYPSAADQQYRRSMYTFWKRSSPPPMLTAFDAPSRETCTVRRQETNTPLQAFVLLNDPQFVAAAESFAKRILREADDSTEARLELAFQLAVSRPPTSDEQQILSTRLERLKSQHVAQSQTARFVSSPASPADRELSAWTIVASIILNLDEVITRN